MLGITKHQKSLENPWFFFSEWDTAISSQGVNAISVSPDLQTMTSASGTFVAKSKGRGDITTHNFYAEYEILQASSGTIGPVAGFHHPESPWYLGTFVQMYGSTPPLPRVGAIALRKVGGAAKLNVWENETGRPEVSVSALWQPMVFVVRAENFVVSSVRLRKPEEYTLNKYLTLV